MIGSVGQVGLHLVSRHESTIAVRLDRDALLLLLLVSILVQHSPIWILYNTKFRRRLCHPSLKKVQEPEIYLLDSLFPIVTIGKCTQHVLFIYRFPFFFFFELAPPPWGFCC
jgi:hypothetical protein